MKVLKKYGYLPAVVLYGLFYLLVFSYLEQREIEPHIIHMRVDDWIPFCAVFVVPYLLWYGYVALVAGWFLFFCRDRRECVRLLGSLGTGMSVFLLISFIYPNGHDLRPVLEGDGIFVRLVRWVYEVDTPTNILPSIHVFHSVACCAAVFAHEGEGGNRQRAARGAALVLTVLIAASTLLIRQHTVVDVVAALILNAVCFELFYCVDGAWFRRLAGMILGERIVTIPNLLSLFRVFLAFLFLEVYRMNPGEQQRWWLVGILALSGISDFLDGKIARRFHMVSEFGKVLDPIADKLTQAVLLYCLFSRYRLSRYIFLLFVVKESYVAATGARYLMRTKKNEGAKWYGKVSTAVFYAVMIVLLLLPGIAGPVANGLLGFCAACMILALVMYARQFHEKKHEIPGMYG